METTVTNQPGHKGAFAQTMQGGAIYYTPDITAKKPAWREVFDLTTSNKIADPGSNYNGGGSNGGWIQTSLDDRYLYHAVDGPGAPADDDKGTSAYILKLDIQKLLASGDRPECNIDTIEETAAGGAESDCPAMVDILRRRAARTGARWTTSSSAATASTTRPNAKRLAYSNYFVARTGLDGDHRVCLVDVSRRRQAGARRVLPATTTGETLPRLRPGLVAARRLGSGEAALDAVRRRRRRRQVAITARQRAGRPRPRPGARARPARWLRSLAAAGRPAAHASRRAGQRRTAATLGSLAGPRRSGGAGARRRPRRRVPDRPAHATTGCVHRHRLSRPAGPEPGPGGGETRRAGATRTARTATPHGLRRHQRRRRRRPPVRGRTQRPAPTVAGRWSTSPAGERQVFVSHGPRHRIPFGIDTGDDAAPRRLRHRGRRAGVPVRGHGRLLAGGPPRRHACPADELDARPTRPRSRTRSTLLAQRGLEPARRASATTPPAARPRAVVAGAADQTGVDVVDAVTQPATRTRCCACRGWAEPAASLAAVTPHCRSAAADPLRRHLARSVAAHPAALSTRPPARARRWASTSVTRPRRRSPDAWPGLPGRRRPTPRTPPGARRETAARCASGCSPPHGGVHAREPGHAGTRPTSGGSRAAPSRPWPPHRHQPAPTRTHEEDRTVIPDRRVRATAPTRSATRAGASGEVPRHRSPASRRAHPRVHRPSSRAGPRPCSPPSGSPWDSCCSTRGSASPPPGDSWCPSARARRCARTC